MLCFLWYSLCVLVPCSAYRLLTILLWLCLFLVAGWLYQPVYISVTAYLTVTVPFADPVSGRYIKSKWSHIKGEACLGQALWLAVLRERHTVCAACSPIHTIHSWFGVRFVYASKELEAVAARLAFRMEGTSPARSGATRCPGKWSGGCRATANVPDIAWLRMRKQRRIHGGEGPAPLGT